MLIPKPELVYSIRTNKECENVFYASSSSWFFVWKGDRRTINSTPHYGLRVESKCSHHRFIPFCLCSIICCEGMRRGWIGKRCECYFQISRKHMTSPSKQISQNHVNIFCCHRKIILLFLVNDFLFFSSAFVFLFLFCYLLISEFFSESVQRFNF